ncbi:trans-2-enoyl-CoA reductase (NADPH) [Handroanthus impetiginosus]|uniref:Trans-2-enoyl-CoA reductase (NADPH) n=1 Tax=Handroanthus impetiginosus TaxID=429701 RepID=A0A2G9I7A4_9LAMI|nr:trans-2-enoyl-CoA reductase (NADPH) [Handroanthus impetiginosus]
MAENRSQVANSLEPWLKLKNKVVTLKFGCTIIAAARRVDRLQSLCNGLVSARSNEPGQGLFRAVAVELNVSANGPTVDAAVEKAWGAFGRIGSLINNAGVRDLLPGCLVYAPSKAAVNMITKATFFIVKTRATLPSVPIFNK